MKINSFLKTIPALFLEILKLIFFLTSVLLFGYYLLSSIVVLLFPKTQSAIFIFDIESFNPNGYLVIFLSILAVVILIFKRQKKIRMIPLFSFNKEEMIIYTISAYFLAFSFSQKIEDKKLPLIVYQLIFFLLFFSFLNQLAKFYLRFKVDNLSRYFRAIKSELTQIKTKPFDWRRFFQSLIKILKKIVLYLIVLTGLITITVAVSVAVVWQIGKYLAYRDNLRRTFFINKIKPKITTVGEKVVVEGYNFGFKENQFFQIKTNQGSVTDIKDWNNNKIEFIVPLDLKEGQIKLWIERTKTESTLSALLKSNQVDFDVLSRWYFYPQAEEFRYPPSFMSWTQTLIKRIRRLIFLKWSLINLIQ